MVNSVAAVAYYFCLALPAAFTQPGAHLIAEPCTYAAVIRGEIDPLAASQLTITEKAPSRAFSWLKAYYRFHI